MRIIAILVGIILVAIDQISKVWAVNHLGSGNGQISGLNDIKVWEGVFHLHYTPNTGAAWGMLDGKQGFLILVTTIVIIAMLFMSKYLPKSKWGNISKVAFVMVISGAIGNLIDRIFLGYVRDFLYFILINFPVFNIADMLVVVGMGILVIATLFGDLEGEISKKQLKGIEKDNK